MIDSKILQTAQKWSSDSYFDEADRKEIQDLLKENNEKEIVDRFYRTLEFGTGGLRSTLGMGSNRINKYTIRMATQALANVLKESFKSEQIKVAISYDSRKFSFEFAQETAAVLAGNGIQSYIYKRLNPVALLSYSVRYHKAHAGVMITASHNPPEYNGYKVYWSDGCQVVAPHDQMIITDYQKITDFSSIKYVDFETALRSGIIQWTGEEVERSYLDMLKKTAINPELCQKNGDQIKIVYTPLHGTGLVPCTKALEDLNLKNVLLVKEQEKPDSKFSTVKSPNPEDPNALKMAVDLMLKENADIAVGTDPDADRVGVAVKHNGEVVYLTGNQTGILLLHYILENLKLQNRMPAKPLVVKTIVTSHMQGKVANAYGATIVNTLTGFKWIGSKILENEQKNLGYTFVFGSEESYGYLSHDQVRDKDAVNAVALIGEMALWYKTQGLTPIDGLNKLYELYGFFQEDLLSLDYKGKEGAEKIARIMDTFRNYSSTDFCAEKIVAIEDYHALTKRDIASGNIEKLDFPKSNVIGLVLDSGSVVYFRPSGTEPKIKFYFMIQEAAGNLTEKKERATNKTKLFKEFIKSVCDKA